MRKFKFLIFCILLAACSKGDIPKTDAESNASFTIDPVQAIGIDERNNKIWPDVPEEKQVTFATCAKDIAINDAVREEDFTIVDSGSKANIAKVTSDTNGCLRWTENFPYDHLANESYSTIQREIHASGVHKGYHAVSIAIDPWKTNVSEIGKDFRNGGDKTVQLFSKSVSTANADSNLVVKKAKVRLRLNRKKDTANWNTSLIVAFSPEIKRIGLNGEEIDEPLTQGIINTQAILVARDNNNNYFILGKSDPITANFTKNNFTAEIPLSIKNPSQKEYTLEAILNIEPQSAPRGMKPIQGSIPLGFFDKQEIQAEDNLLPLTKDFSQFAITDNGIDKNNKAIGYQVGDVQVVRAWAKKVSEGSGKPETIGVELKVCIFDSLSGNPIINEPFTVQGISSIVTKKTSDDKELGCIHVEDDEVNFNFYDSNGEHYINKEIKITSQSPYYGSDTKTIAIAINPWQFTSTNLFLVDLRNSKIPEVTRTAQEQIPEIFIKDYSQNFIERTFNIDDDLNLSVTRKYRMRLHLDLNRMTMTGWQPDALARGKFKVKILLEQSEFNNKVCSQDTSVKNTAKCDPKENLLFYTEVIAVLDGGDLIFDVPITFKDIRMVVSRNKISFEIAPLDANAKYPLATYTGYYEALVNNYSYILRKRCKAEFELPGNECKIVDDKNINPYENISDLMTGIYKTNDPIQQKPDRMAEFRKAFLLKPVSTEDALSAFSITKAEKEAIITSPENNKEVFKKLCKYFFDPEPVRQQVIQSFANDKADRDQLYQELKKITVQWGKCLLSGPLSVLSYDQTVHVINLENTQQTDVSAVNSIRPNWSDTVNITLATSFNTGRTQTESTSEGNSLDGGLNNALSILPFIAPAAGLIGKAATFALSGGYKFNISKDKTEAFSKATRIDYSSAKTINADEITLDLKMNVLNCLAINIKPELQDPAHPKEGLHFCQNQTEIKEVQESYYYIYQYFTNPMSPVNDAQTPLERPWTIIIRSDARFKSFLSTIQKESVQVKLQSEPPYPNILFNQAYKHFDGGIFPGLYLP